MLYKVIRKEISTGKIFITECTQEQINNIVKHPISLYSLESIEPITDHVITGTTEPIDTNQETEQKTYTYYFRLRPPMPGCQPKEGLIEIDSNSITYNNREYWGTATYNKPLTASELYDYDLDA